MKEQVSRNAQLKSEQDFLDYANEKVKSGQSSNANTVAKDILSSDFEKLKDSISRNRVKLEESRELYEEANNKGLIHENLKPQWEKFFSQFETSTHSAPDQPSAIAPPSTPTSQGLGSAIAENNLKSEIKKNEKEKGEIKTFFSIEKIDEALKGLNEYPLKENWSEQILSQRLWVRGLPLMEEEPIAYINDGENKANKAKLYNESAKYINQLVLGENKLKEIKDNIETKQKLIKSREEKIKSHSEEVEYLSGLSSVSDHDLYLLKQAREAVNINQSLNQMTQSELDKLNANYAENRDYYESIENGINYLLKKSGQNTNNFSSAPDQPSAIASRDLVSKATQPNVTITIPAQNVEELKVKANNVLMGDQDKVEGLVQLALSGNIYAKEALESETISLSNLAHTKENLSQEIYNLERKNREVEWEIKRFRSDFDFDSLNNNLSMGDKFKQFEEIVKEKEVELRKGKGVLRPVEQIDELQRKMNDLDALNAYIPPTNDNIGYYELQALTASDAVLNHPGIHHKTRELIAKEMENLLKIEGNYELIAMQESFQRELENSNLSDEEKEAKLDEFSQQNDPVYSSWLSLKNKWEEKLENKPTVSFVSDQFDRFYDGLRLRSFLISKQKILQKTPSSTSIDNSDLIDKVESIAPPSTEGKTYTATELASMNESEKRGVFKDVVDRVNQQLEGHSMFKELKDAINNHHKIKFGRNGKADYQEFMDKYYDEPSKYMRSIFMETGTPFARKIASLHSKISEDLGLPRKVEDAYKTENLDWDSIYLNSQQPSPPVTPEQKRTQLRQKQQVEAMSVKDFLDRETPHVEFYYDGEKRSMEYETTPDSFRRGKLKKQVEQDLFKRAAWAIKDNSSNGVGIIKSNGVIHQISRESAQAKLITKEEATKLLSPVSENVNSEAITPKPSANTELIDEAIASQTSGYLERLIQPLSISGHTNLANNFVNKFKTKGEKRDAQAFINRANKKFSETIREYRKMGVILTSDGYIWVEGTNRKNWYSSAFYDDFGNLHFLDQSSIRTI